MCDSYCCHKSCGKRSREDNDIVLPEIDKTDEGPSLKSSRRPSLDASCSKTASPPVKRLPLARSLKEFLEPGGFMKYLPRPEWYTDSNSLKVQEANTYNTDAHAPFYFQIDENISESDFTFLPITENYPSAKTEMTRPRKSVKAAVFGKDMDHALHVAIREHATQCALILLDYGAPVEAENAKRATPLIVAAQKGNVTIVRELLGRGADITAATLTGLTAILQAAHFGKTDVLKLLLQSGSSHLIECANHNQTTPLMRASQEGHVQAVKLLLEAGAQVNRRNRSHLTALMLASQRGHASVVQALIKHGAEIDAMTHEDSTALLLACRRGNIDVARVLVTAGCELSVRDSRGRTAQELAVHKNQKCLVDILDPAVQIGLMRTRARHSRNFEIVRIWHLLQQERASIPIFDSVKQSPLGVHNVKTFLSKSLLPYPIAHSSTLALVRTMTLPEPLVRTIAQFLSAPLIWESRIKILTKRSSVSPDDAVSECLDLIDEILEEGGFPEACDDAGVSLPAGLEFDSWTAWKTWGHQKGVAEASDTRRSLQRNYLTTADCPAPRDCNRPTFVEWRRYAGFLQLLQRERLSKLGSVLISTPYKMPPVLVDRLVHVSDAASLVRRMRSGVHFEMHVAMDLVMLASQLCSWYWREREERL